VHVDDIAHGTSACGHRGGAGMGRPRYGCGKAMALLGPRIGRACGAKGGERRPPRRVAWEGARQPRESCGGGRLGHRIDNAADMEEEEDCSGWRKK